MVASLSLIVMYLAVFSVALLKFFSMLLFDVQYLFENLKSGRGETLVDVELRSHFDAGSH